MAVTKSLKGLINGPSSKNAPSASGLEAVTGRNFDGPHFPQ